MQEQKRTFYSEIKYTKKIKAIKKIYSSIRLITLELCRIQSPKQRHTQRIIKFSPYLNIIPVQTKKKTFSQLKSLSEV